VGYLIRKLEHCFLTNTTLNLDVRSASTQEANRQNRFFEGEIDYAFMPFGISQCHLRRDLIAGDSETLGLHHDV
jgi:hypothetical protein